MKIKFKILCATLAMFVFQGCLFDSDYHDVSSKSPYAEMMGRKFVVQQDCYLCGTYNRDYLSVANLEDFRLPRKVSPEFIGTRVSYNFVIYAILKKGMTIQIIGCKVQYNPENGNITDYQAKVNDESFNGIVVGLVNLTDLTKMPPTFYPDWLKPSDSK